MNTDPESDPPADQQVFRPEDWLTASETIRLVRATTLSRQSHITIATRAHAGLVRAHAELLMRGADSVANVDVPRAFWWAGGHEALTQNWDTGDFSTWIDKRVEVRAFGVRFYRDDIKRMIPVAFPGEQSLPPKPEARNVGGRRMSELWPDWVAELAAHVHDEGIPQGTGSQGADELIETIATRLATRGLEAPGRTTVQETAAAVLRRLRTP